MAGSKEGLGAPRTEVEADAATLKGAAISRKTATDIAMAWREVETAQALLEEIVSERQRHQGQAPDIRDAFGRRQDGLQLGVPSGASSHRLFNVPWALCKPIIEAHISAQMSLIAVLSAKARIETDGITETPAQTASSSLGSPQIIPKDDAQ